MAEPACSPSSEPKLVCFGCGAEVAPTEPYPFRCPNLEADDGRDHVLQMVAPCVAPLPLDGDPNPFVRFRQSLFAWQRARRLHVADHDWIASVRRLDAAVAAVDGHGFVITPLARHDRLSAALGCSPHGGVFVKDETGNVAGSHKARHLFGLGLHLDLAKHLGAAARPQLAIASCGNAALAAAVVAHAAELPLTVFVPPDAPPPILQRLVELGAGIEVCPRAAGQRGDPSVHRLRQACSAGALPFCCQGNENGLTIDGGLTIGLEIAADFARRHDEFAALFIQVGGGALGSACAQALTLAQRTQALPRLPRIHAVQTSGCAPLAIAYDRLLQRVERRLQLPHGTKDQRAARVAAHASHPELDDELRRAARQRAEFMVPWPQPPHSLARGILDDETYDWLALCTGMLRSGGYPVVVDEATVAEANTLARTATGIAVDPTGTAGLAGLLAYSKTTAFDPDERVVVVFSGKER